MTLLSRITTWIAQRNGYKYLNEKPVERGEPTETERDMEVPE